MSICENCKSLDICTVPSTSKEACFFFSPTEKYRIENSKEYAIGYERGRADERAKTLEEVECAMYYQAFNVDHEKDGLQRWDAGNWIRYKLFENVLKELKERKDV